MEWCLKELNPNWNKSLIWNTTKNARFILVIIPKLKCVGEFKSKFNHQVLFSKTNNVLIHSPVSSNRIESSNNMRFSTIQVCLVLQLFLLSQRNALSGKGSSHVICYFCSFKVQLYPLENSLSKQTFIYPFHPYCPMKCPWGQNVFNLS